MFCLPVALNGSQFSPRDRVAELIRLGIGTDIKRRYSCLFWYPYSLPNDNPPRPGAYCRLNRDTYSWHARAPLYNLDWQFIGLMLIAPAPNVIPEHRVYVAIIDVAGVPL